MNFAIGYEYSPREQLTLFGSFLTDFSSAAGDASAAHSFSTWDIFQITGGAAFTFQNVDFTFGASFAAGGEEIDRQNDVGITPVLNPVEVRYRRIKVFIGFEFGKGGHPG